MRSPSSSVGTYLCNSHIPFHQLSYTVEQSQLFAILLVGTLLAHSISFNICLSTTYHWLPIFIISGFSASIRSIFLYFSIFVTLNYWNFFLLICIRFSTSVLFPIPSFVPSKTTRKLSFHFCFISHFPFNNFPSLFFTYCISTVFFYLWFLSIPYMIHITHLVWFSLLFSSSSLPPHIFLK